MNKREVYAWVCWLLRVLTMSIVFGVTGTLLGCNVNLNGACSAYDKIEGVVYYTHVKQSGAFDSANYDMWVDFHYGNNASCHYLDGTYSKRSKAEKHLEQSFPIGSTRDLLVRHIDHTCIDINEGHDFWIGGLAFLSLTAVALAALATFAYYIWTGKICTDAYELELEPVPARARVLAPRLARAQVPHARLALNDDRVLTTAVEIV